MGFGLTGAELEVLVQGAGLLRPVALVGLLLDRRGQGVAPGRVSVALEGAGQLHHMGVGVVDRLAYLKKFKRTDIPMVLEGGSIDMNGRGTCLTTEQCLLNSNRNPELSRRDIEDRLKKYLGVRQVLWLKEGIEGDDTDGHVDDITRFVAPGIILTAMENDTRDMNHGILKENFHVLHSARDAAGKKFNIVPFPMPGRVGVKKGHSLPAGQAGSSGRLPASYANFYIGNKAVLLPVYSHRNDRQAERILKKLFPGRKVVPIECTALVYGLGSIHCVTQQQPR